MGEHPDIRAVLPQRYPMLLVDRILELDPGCSIRTVKAVTATEPCYAALPDNAEPWRYHYPPALLVESFGQSAALLWLGGVPPPDDGLTLMFIGATDFVFEGAVLPGDVLTHIVRLDTVIAGTAFASGETWAGSRRVARVANLVATRRPVRPTTGPADASVVAAGAPSGFHRSREGSR